MKKDSAINRQYKEMSRLRRSLSSIYSHIASLSLATKLWLFLVLLIRAIAEIVLEGSEVPEILVVSDWLDLCYRCSLPPSYLRAHSVFACPSWHSGENLHCWRGWAANLWELLLGLSTPKRTGGSKSMNCKTFPRFLDVFQRTSVKKYMWLHWC